MKFVDGGFAVAMSVSNDLFRRKQIDDSFLLGCPWYNKFSLDTRNKGKLGLHVCKFGDGAILAHDNINNLIVAPDPAMHFR